jgi:hypothetical protein
VSSAAISFCVASQRVFIVVDFVIDSVRKLLDTPSYKPADHDMNESLLPSKPLVSHNEQNIYYGSLYRENHFP